MKFRYLISLPLVALLASCNAGDNGAAKVKQNLPQGETVVSTEDENYADYVGSMVTGTLNGLLNLQDTVYHYGLDIDTKVSVSAEGVKSSNSLSVHGGLTYGWAQTGSVNLGDEEEPSLYPLYSGFAHLEFTTLKAHVEIPTVEYIKDGEGNIVDAKTGVAKIDVNFSGLEAAFVIEETAENGTWLYLDASNEKLQDLIIFALEAAGIPEETTLPEDPEEESVIGYGAILDGLLGEKGENGYRPGKAKANITTILNGLFGEVEEFAQLVPFFAHPFAVLYYTLAAYAYEEIQAELNIQQLVAMIAAFLPALKGKLGVKLEDEKPVEVSAVINSSVKDVVKAFAGDEAEEALKEIPVSGNFGILLSVGTQTGSKFLALQELVLAVALNINYQLKDDDGKVVVKVSGSVDAKAGIAAVYGTDVEIPELSAEEKAECSDVTIILGMLVAYLMSQSSHGEVEPEVI